VKLTCWSCRNTYVYKHYSELEDIVVGLIFERTINMNT